MEPMKCQNCDVENMPDALYCRRCGKGIRVCLNCAVTHEADALYCRRCGKPLKARAGEFAEAVTREVSGGAAAHAPEFDDDVDFTTKVSPKQVERLAGGRGPGRGSRAPAYVAAALMLATVLIAVLALWQSARTTNLESAQQSEALKADLEEFKKTVRETEEAERRAILEDIGVVLAKARAEERKATNEEIRKVVARAREEDRKDINAEIAKAVAKTREEDRGIIVAELTKLKKRTKSREFNQHLDRVIAMFKMRGRPGADPRRGDTGGESRWGANRWREDTLAE
jgi:ferredoxin